MDDTVITCSPEHPFWVPGSGWRKAESLNSGAALLARGEQLVTVRSLCRREGSFRVFNLAVNGCHTYQVSDLAILVHNKAVNLEGRTDLLVSSALELFVPETPTVGAPQALREQRMHLLEEAFLLRRHAISLGAQESRLSRRAGGRNKDDLLDRIQNLEYRIADLPEIDDVAPPRLVADPVEIAQGIRRVRDLLSEPEVRAARRDNRSFEGELQKQLRNQEGRTIEEQLDAARTEVDTARELGDPDFISEAQQRLDVLQAQVESLETTLRGITEGDLPGEPIVEGPFANELPGRGGERARVEQSPETRANFRRQLAPGEIEGAPAVEGGTGQTGHARSGHGWSDQMQAELLNNPDRVFTGFNKNARLVDVYYRNNGDVAITVAGRKEQVITTYGPSDPDGEGKFNPVSKWADNPRYVEINPRNGRPIPPTGGEVPATPVESAPPEEGPSPAGDLPGDRE